MMTDVPSNPSPSPPARPGLAGALVVTGLLAAALWIVIGLGVPARTTATTDQDEFHLHAIRGFAEQWPQFDLVNYRSATTPGYHIALAAVSRFLTDDLALLRLAGSLFALGLVLTLGVAVARRCGPWTAAALCLPLACSSYIVAAGGWLLPDNAGWWGVLAVLLAAWAYRPSWRWHVGVAGILVILVLVRQIHIWAAGVLWLAAWIGRKASDTRDQTSLALLLGDGRDLHRRAARVLLALLVTLPALAALAYFANLWGGLVPPMFHGEGTDPLTGNPKPRNSGGNLAAPAAVLALLGAIGPFYAGYVWTVLRRGLTGDRAVLAGLGAGAALGCLVAALPHTDWSLAEGRYSGLWNIVRATPTFAHRSPFLIALATLGGATLAAWLIRLAPRDRLLFAATWAAFTAAHATSAMAWQRYYEPFILIALSLAAARALPAADDRFGRPAAVIGPILLAALLALSTVVRV